MSKKSTKEILDELSSHNFDNVMPLKYTKKHQQSLSDKFIKGKVGAADWISDLIYEFQQREKKLLDEFENVLIAQSNDLALRVKEGDYKKGTLESFELIVTQLENLKKKL